MNIQGKKILVTGGKGFLGQAVTRELHRRGAPLVEVPMNEFTVVLEYEGEYPIEWVLGDCPDDAAETARLIYACRLEGLIEPQDPPEHSPPSKLKTRLCPIIGP